jgi:pretoxin HINT domain-containing protein
MRDLDVDNEPEDSPPEQMGGGFVAGTLVHTDRGLVPIEQIRVGDMVLSQPQETGELAYKRVLRTFSFEDREVGLVEYTRVADLREDGQEQWEHLVATKNYPFFVKGIGWTRADHLDPGSQYDLILRDGSFARCIYLELRNTEVQNVALGMNIHYFDDVGTLVDLRGRPPEIIDRDTDNAYASDLEGGFCTQRVYNIEVEGYHTHYVGEAAVWVHDTDGSSTT